jgi:hypothetical protein
LPQKFANHLGWTMGRLRSGKPESLLIGQAIMNLLIAGKTILALTLQLFPM